MAKTISQNQALKIPVKLEKTRAAKPKAVKIIEKKVWVALTPADCLKSIKTAAHLSSKSVNSNASPVGVRLDPADRLPMNFVAVSTLDAAKIPVDYAMGGAGGAGRFHQITSVFNGSSNEFFTDISPEQVAMIESMRGELLSSASVGAEFIDPRLRQVIWPTGETASPWVAITPLQSSGLSEVIRSRLGIEATAQLELDANIGTGSRPKALLGIGGAKIQNVGRYAGSMQSPLVFDGPKEVKSIRAAYALHYKGHLRGLAFAPPKKQTLAFALWRHRLQEANGQKMPSNVDIRQEEIDHIQSIANASLNEAAAARHILAQHLDHLSSLTVPTMDTFLRALIDPDLRDRTFKEKFARKLIRSIERFRFKIGKNEYVVCGDNELVALISAAEEVCP